MSVQKGLPSQDFLEKLLNGIVLISIFDRSNSTYIIMEDPFEINKHMPDIPLDELNRGFELAVDGQILPWPHTDPDIVVNYVFEVLSDQQALGG